MAKPVERTREDDLKDIILSLNKIVIKCELTKIKLFSYRACSTGHLPGMLNNKDKSKREEGVNVRLAHNTNNRKGNKK